MTQTLATEKQSNAIKQRMRQIRSDLPYDVDHARHRIREVTDWKYHLRKHPVMITAGAALVGYLLVPNRQRSQHVVVRNESPVASKAEAGIAGGLVGALGAFALRQGSAFAVRAVTQRLSRLIHDSSITS